MATFQRVNTAPESVGVHTDNGWEVRLYLNDEGGLSVVVGREDRGDFYKSNFAPAHDTYMGFTFTAGE